jgi:3-dehydroquinate dehydratase-2
MASILILNGPNLNLLGEREPHIYGSTTLAQIEERCRQMASELGYDLTFKQSNHEGDLIDSIQEVRKTHAAIIINPGAYSFTSLAIMSTLKAISLPVVEVHISNIHRPESFCHESVISQAAVGVVCGLGPHGYESAIRFLSHHLAASTAAASKP